MAASDYDIRYEITWLIRRLFRAMGQTADGYLRDSGISAADRAVMEFLFPDHELSVPEIAGMYKVSRQHVQSTVNELLDKGLVVTSRNPRHRRSPLVRLHELGRQTFAEIRRNEAAFVADLFNGLSDERLDVTRNTLKKLLTRLD